MEFIRRHMEQLAPLSDEDWAFFSARLVRSEVPKKTILLDVGQTENYLSFAERGVIRFYIPGEENDLTFAFVFEGNFISAYDSFLTRRPSVYRTETLSHTILWKLHYNDLQDIYAGTQIGNTIGRLAGEDLFLKKSLRELSLLTQSAEQRYRSLFTEQPQLIRQIPLKYIASYIGVAPQSLSRIRRRIS